MKERAWAVAGLSTGWGSPVVLGSNRFPLGRVAGVAERPGVACKEDEEGGDSWVCGGWG